MILSALSRLRLFPVAAIAALLVGANGLAAPPPTGNSSRRPTAAQHAARQLMVHYMPWFEARPFDTSWGWHWTMNHFNPDKMTGARREIAAHDYPLTGPYASDDPDVLEYQVLLMKLSGIDGVIFDWYGPADFLDYGLIQRNCEKMIAELRKAHLSFAVCFEDQTLPHLIAAKRITAAEDVSYGQGIMRWLGSHWFRDADYLRLSNHPVLLVFGPQYYPDSAWPKLFEPLSTPPAFFTLHVRRDSAIGSFDWPRPDPGLRAVDDFYRRVVAYPTFIPTAFPGFHDIYKDAGVSAGYPEIPDNGGRTYAETLDRALQIRASIIQIATWNDWGEGTQVEPSVESGYRDLEKTQQSRRRYLDPSFPYSAADLRLPLELYTLRKKSGGDPSARAALDAAARLLFVGRAAQARNSLRRFERGLWQHARMPAAARHKR